MLRDADIQALDSHVGSIIQDNEQHHERVQGLLERFQLLLDSYNQLRSDYEEERENREKYKKLARGQERNPFALVLIDGDGYQFKEHLIRASAEGGITAARLLNDSIKELLHERLGPQADQCRIMVRIYSNLLGLSRSLARNGLVGNEARSLSPFASSFTRSQDLFDYIDAGDKKEGADYKIREFFRLFVENNQCKHIFFAGCHDTGYLSLLTPYVGKSERITLLRAASFHPEFESLGLSIREVPSVFMSTPLGSTHVPSTPATPTRPICKHFQKGTCRYGADCTKLHIASNPQVSKQQDRSPPPPWRTPVPTRDQAYFSRHLPRDSRKSREFIAVNKNGERLDTYSPLPSPDAWDAYNRRAKQHRLCNKYHLGGECGDLSCEYDHSNLESTCVSVMQYILRQHACSRGPSCRSLKCYLGHICQRDGCKGTKPCKFSRHAHLLDLDVAQWVAPIEHEMDETPLSDGSLEVNSTTDPNNSFSFLMKDVVF
ncbi:zinc finger CCCH domain-containing protein [Aspergillus candidus]|uniref:C3H1-type domain-containing protein n=1 Tax=Aspergillus candidus TaxID=41067 RepID=A0A2I2FBA2_ASPCN|nr:hypothetical protein BDW47DRAFT_106027 [Aspergillus candidus]PLB37911.1 hypothetical protein BDW47DRAFT_106027 [Aspergillus candidus]